MKKYQSTKFKKVKNTEITKSKKAHLFINSMSDTPL